MAHGKNGKKKKQDLEKESPPHLGKRTNAQKPEISIGEEPSNKSSSKAKRTLPVLWKKTLLRHCRERETMNRGEALIGTVKESERHRKDKIQIGLTVTSRIKGRNANSQGSPKCRGELAKGEGVWKEWSQMLGGWLAQTKPGNKNGS